MPADRFRPPDNEPGRIVATVGLVSDTHLPMRRRTLPPALFDVFHGVDLILHAGDVGELRVLDELSALAPVIAVHGNDDSVAAEQHLPYRHVIPIHGQRILLWHSHYPDRATELASRLSDTLIPKLDRNVHQAQHAGANIVVFGHWHIPLVYQKHGVTVINPGALASPNAFTRGLHHTVALLFLLEDRSYQVVHVDLAQPDRRFDVSLDFSAGFRKAALPYTASIVDADLESMLAYLLRHMIWDDLKTFAPTWSELAHPIWEGEDRLFSLTDFDAGLEQAASVLAPHVLLQLRQLRREWAHRHRPTPSPT